MLKEEICPKCQVESFLDGKCRFCYHEDASRVLPVLNKKAAARPYCICPSCLSYISSNTKCYYCAYEFQNHDFEKYEQTPYTAFIKLFNQKKYKEAVDHLQQSLAINYSEHLHKTLLSVLDMYFYGIAPVPDRSQENKI